MKTRNGLVSNSSSSNFIIFTSDIDINSYLLQGIIDCCGGFVLLEPIKDFAMFPFFITKNGVKIELVEPEYFKESNELLFDLRNIPEDINIFETMNTVKTFGKKLQLCTGAVLSEAAPQLCLQSILLDLNIDYETIGDGVIDIRNPKFINGIDEEYLNWVKGPIKLIIDKYSSTKG